MSGLSSPADHRRSVFPLAYGCFPSGDHPTPNTSAPPFRVSTSLPEVVSHTRAVPPTPTDASRVPVGSNVSPSTTASHFPSGEYAHASGTPAGRSLAPTSQVAGSHITTSKPGGDGQPGFEVGDEPVTLGVVHREALLDVARYEQVERVPSGAGEVVFGGLLLVCDDGFTHRPDAGRVVQRHRQLVGPR